jgi:hypothetical protein
VVLLDVKGKLTAAETVKYKSHCGANLIQVDRGTAHFRSSVPDGGERHEWVNANDKILQDKLKLAQIDMALRGGEEGEGFLVVVGGMDM